MANTNNQATTGAHYAMAELSLCDFLFPETSYTQYEFFLVSCLSKKD